MNKIATTVVSTFAMLAIIGCGDLQADESHSHDDHQHEAAESDSDHHDEEMRHADAHSHGDAKLAIALDETALYIELDTPLYNLTGFEHAPRTPDEIDVHQKVEAVLAQPERLFSVNPEAGCSPRDGVEGVQLSSAAEHDEHAHDAPGHGDEHAKDETDLSNTHRDLVVEYIFDCRSPGRIDEIVVHLFELFPRIEELDSVYLDQSTQRSIHLTPDNHRINLAR